MAVTMADMSVAIMVPCGLSHSHAARVSPT